MGQHRAKGKRQKAESSRQKAVTLAVGIGSATPMRGKSPTCREMLLKSVGL